MSSASPSLAHSLAQAILRELKPLGSPSYRKVLFNHGVPDPCFGVKISDLKVIQKRVKTDHELALSLFDTGVYDARYLAGLVADDAKMTKQDLRHWLKSSNCAALRESTVPWVAAGGRYGYELALDWIGEGAKDEGVASAGWATLSSLVSIKADSELNLPMLKKLLGQVSKTLQDQPNRVRYCMNGFVIAAGSYVASLTDEAISTARSVGSVRVEMGNTSCEVPSAVAAIEKVRERAAIGKKRKTAKC
jgi:3-methyladenine DNA glycosylase AlkD